MNASIKPKIPLLFLIAISVFWMFYYQGSHSFNDYGRAKFEWLYLLDALVVLPVLCFVFISDKKAALIKALVFSGLAVLIGSYIVPEQNQFILNDLEKGRYLVLAVVVLFELVAILTVYLAIKSSLNQRLDPDLSIEQPIKRFLGQGLVAEVLNFETRVWAYVFLGGRIKPEQFAGQAHFSYHQKDGAESNLLGFVVLIMIEMPLMHVLLHYIWSPFAANIITLITLLTLAFFFAEYRAISRRPISLVGDVLVIRCGVFKPYLIPLNNITSICTSDGYVKRSKQVKRYNYSGCPNVVIELIRKQDEVNQVYLGVDEPERFLKVIKQGLNSSPDSHT